MNFSGNYDPKRGRYGCIFIHFCPAFCINIQSRVKVFRQLPRDPRALKAQQYGAWGCAPGTQPTSYLRAVGAKVAVGVTWQSCPVPGAWPTYVLMVMAIAPSLPPLPFGDILSARRCLRGRLNNAKVKKHPFFLCIVFGLQPLRPRP